MRAGDVGEGTVVARGHHVGTVAVEGRVLLVDEGAGRGFALNPTGSLVWQLLDAVTPLGELIDELADAFGAPRHEVSKTVTALVRTLGLLGMLEGVARSIASVPIDIEYVDVDDCGEPVPGDSGTEATVFDGRYLAAPPNA